MRNNVAWCPTGRIDPAVVDPAIRAGDLRYLVQIAQPRHPASDIWKGRIHVKRLRARIEENPSTPRRITTVRGVGYRYDLGVGKDA